MSVDCLLIHVPKTRNYYPLLGRHMFGMSIPMGLFSVAGYAREKGYTVRILHAGLERIRDGKFSLAARAAALSPAVAGFDLHWHHQSYDVIEAARELKKTCPRTFVVLGGLTAGFFHRQILEAFPFIDAVIRGDGELPFARLIEARTRAAAYDPAGIPNLSWRRADGAVMENGIGYVADAADMAGFDFACLDLLDNRELYRDCASPSFFWVPRLGRRVNRMLSGGRGYFPLPVMRGCDDDCSFCGGGREACAAITGRGSVSYLPVQAALEAIERIKSFGYDTIFMDIPPGAGGRDYFDDLFARIKDRGIGIGCVAGLRGLPSREFAARFAAAFDPRRSKILLSPETGSEEVRRLNKSRYFGNRELEEAVDFCTASGIFTEIYFLLGMPFETAETVAATKAYQDSLRKRFGKMIAVRTEIVSLEPGSRLYLHPEKYDMVRTRNGFLDYYHAHRGGKSRFPADLGYYPAGRDEASFKKETEENLCRRFCRLSPCGSGIRGRIARAVCRAAAWLNTALIVLALCVSAPPARAEDVSPEQITVSGTVEYPEYQKGIIDVFWVPELTLGRPDAHNITRLSRPGPFSLRVPAGQGTVYIRAGIRDRLPHRSLAYFVSDPLPVGTKDIKDYRIILTTNRLRMAGYKGRTVKIHGRIKSSRFAGGVINVCAYSRQWFGKTVLPPDINTLDLASPGTFDMEVPANAGEIFLTAVNVLEGEKTGNCPRCPRGAYPGNPVRVGNRDIKGIEISID